MPTPLKALVLGSALLLTPILLPAISPTLSLSQAHAQTTSLTARYLSNVKNVQLIQQGTNKTLNISLNPINVASGFKRVPSVLLTRAVIYILGEGVDYILDPANNTIRYTLKPNNEYDKTHDYVFDNSNPTAKRYPTMDALCKANRPNLTFKQSIWVGRQGKISGIFIDANNNQAELECGFAITKTTNNQISLTDLSAQLVDKAQQGDKVAQQILVDLTLARVESGEFEWGFGVATLSKGGKQNIDNEYVRMVQNQQNGDKDPCEWLRDLRLQTKDKEKLKKIKIAEKRFNCDGRNRFDKKY